MERFLNLEGAQGALSAILHAPNTDPDRAVLIVVGGPQYRVGSHRMFVRLARALADSGVAVLRFDFAGMGDSDGEFPGFDRVSDDIAVACDALLNAHTSCTDVTIIGLCDGASAAAIYADQDPRVTQLILLNPWVHTEVGEAKAFVWHYYPRRLISGDFWRGVFTGKVNPFKAVGGLAAKLKKAFSSSGSDDEDIGFIERMRRGLAGFDGRVSIVLSDTDLTAAEFSELVKSDASWASVVAGTSTCAINRADHTFSTERALQEYIARCRDFVLSPDR